MMANISAGDFRATIEYNDVQLQIEHLGQGGFACVFKCQLHGEMAAANLFTTSKTIEVKAVKNEAKTTSKLATPKCGSIHRVCSQGKAALHYYRAHEQKPADVSQGECSTVTASSCRYNATNSRGNEILA
jgi:hypothetical protein